MAYTRYSYHFDDSIEYEFHYAGRYGAPGEKRAKKCKPTQDASRKYNHKLKENKVRRLIKANFKKYDYWVTLKYPKGTRKGVEEVQKDIRKFLDSLRKKYKRRGRELKFIYRMEIGSRGGIHCHAILPRIDEGDRLIQESWKQGHVNFENLYETGGYEQLASYIVKEPDEEAAEQLSLFDLDSQKHLIKYSTSRNLIRPEPKKKRYMRWTVRKLIENSPKPTEGYYIDKNSIRTGVNQWTGMSYLYYTEILIKKGEDSGSKYISNDQCKKQSSKSG